MATRHFSLTTTVSGDPGTAVDFLADLPRHVGLHPFLVSATVVASGHDDDGRWWDYQIVERPRLWRLRYTMRFPARVVRTSPTSVRSDVQALPGCRLTAVTHANPVGDGRVLVSEETTVTAPLPVVGYMTRSARAAHARTFELLEAHLPGSGST